MPETMRSDHSRCYVTKRGPASGSSAHDAPMIPMTTWTTKSATSDSNAMSNGRMWPDNGFEIYRRFTLHDRR